MNNIKNYIFGIYKNYILKIIHAFINYIKDIYQVLNTPSTIKGYRALKIMIRKEIADHIRSYRFIIMIGIITLTCIGSVYTAITNIDKLLQKENSENFYFFLKLFTATDGTMPSFIVFISFLGPLLGLTIAFDAINHEHNRGTLSRILSQPIPRDYIIHSKFIAALSVVAALFFSLALMVIGSGIVILGMVPTPEEIIRIMFFILVSILYIALWINIAILFSIRFRQPATSALAGIAVWLFVTVFYPLLINFALKSIEPNNLSPVYEILRYERIRLLLVQLMPNELFMMATSVLLVPSIRNIGPVTFQQLAGSIPSPLPVDQSLLIVWQQIIILIGLTVICFILSYLSFMRREIRSR